MLPVNFNEARTNRFQRLHANGLIIHKGTRATICHLHTAQNNIAFMDNIIVAQERMNRMIGRGLKNRRHLTLRFPVSHKRAVPTRTQGQCKGIKQD